MSCRWLRQLVNVGLDQPSLRGLGTLAEVIARSTGMSRVLIWREIQLNGAPVPRVMAAWPDVGALGALVPDPATLAALQGETAGSAEDGARGRCTGDGAVRTSSIAFPVGWADGSNGALTMLGEGHVAEQTLGIVEDLIDVLPMICAAIKERQTLALVNACNEILRAADVASPTEPLAHEQLSIVMGTICRTIADDLGFVYVSIYLRQPGHAAGTHPLFASSKSGGLVTGIDERGQGLMTVPVSSGGHLWGRIECAGTLGPYVELANCDLSLLTPVAAQIGLYWSHWLHREEISNENRCWRNLASGITLLNDQMGSQLARRRPQREPVYQAAFEVIHEVVPECVAVEVRAEERGGSGALTVTSTDRWDSADEDGWHVATAIRVSEAAYGVLGARGADDTLPANSTQVCQIIADQLGLYHFLRETLGDLRDTQKALERTLASQAMALEDIKHQLVSPLVAATVKTEGVLQSGRFDGRTDVHLRAVRGLCRRAGRVALSAGIFSMLSKGQLPSPKSELLSVDELLRLMILCADDAQVLIDPRRKIRVDVDRSSFRSVGRRLVQADRSFLEQCVGNLVDNAAKYSYDGTTVGICGTVAEASLALCVSSCGIPIQPADVDRCLRRNWRGRAARTATGEGSGLGLWIVDNLIRSMDGAVEIAVAGDATAVSLRLPFARTAQ